MSAMGQNISARREMMPRRPEEMSNIGQKVMYFREIWVA